MVTRRDDDGIPPGRLALIVLAALAIWAVVIAGGFGLVELVGRTIRGTFR